MSIIVSRARLIAPHPLAAALRAGRPGAAAIDVYEEEPVFGAGNELLALDDIGCTPHVGHVGRNQREDYFSDQFDRVLAYASRDAARRRESSGAAVKVDSPTITGRTA